MHARVTMVTGATNIDGGIEHMKNEVIPGLRQMKGYRGLTISGDRSNGVVNVLSLWDTEADLDASESAIDKIRQQAVNVFGGTFTVERYEQVFSDVAATGPTPGAKLHIREIKMDPAKIDENVEFFKQVVVPEMKASQGFLSVRNLINRSTGEGRVGSVWKDQASLDAQLAQTEQRRSRAADRGVTFGGDRVAEVLFAAIE